MAETQTATPPLSPAEMVARGALDHAASVQTRRPGPTGPVDADIMEIMAPRHPAASESIPPSMAPSEQNLSATPAAIAAVAGTELPGRALSPHEIEFIQNARPPAATQPPVPAGRADVAPAAAPVQRNAPEDLSIPEDHKPDLEMIRSAAIRLVGMGLPVPDAIAKARKFEHQYQVTMGPVRDRLHDEVQKGVEEAATPSPEPKRRGRPRKNPAVAAMRGEEPEPPTVAQPVPPEDFPELPD